MPEDTKPDPSQTSSDEEPVGGEPGAASTDDTSGSGEPGSGKADGREKLGEQVQRRLQGVMDENIHRMQTGQFDKMDPKVVELLSAYTDLQRHAGDAAGVTQPDRGDPFKPSDRTGAPGSGQGPLSDEELGRRTRMQAAYETIRSRVESDVLADNWVEDAQALFAEFHDVAVDPKDFEAVDPLDTRRFPRTREGYRKWRTAATEFRKKYYGSATGEDEGETSAVDADREGAGQTRKPPAPTGSRRGITSLAQAAKLRREGKMSDADYLAQIEKFSNA